VDIQTTLQLRPLIPGNILVVSESGIRSAQDVNLLKENKVDAILVGEAIVTASFIANMVRSLSENHRGREESS
jgi:indole-3-glycerol phosphate synthase